MTIKASGRSALIIAAGIWACFAAPVQALEGVDSETPTVSKATTSTGAPIVLKRYAKPRHAKKVAQRKSSKVALNSAAGKKAAETDTADNDVEGATAIPPSVANANAQWASADTPAGDAKAMSVRASTILQAASDNPVATPTAPDTQVVSADQLNEVDRALHESKPPPPITPATITVASAEAPVAPTAPAVASSTESSTWDETSLIGKIFIGFGALLTMASAARMFMA